MLKIHDEIEQGTVQWHRLRAGLPTASEFATILAQGKGGGESKTRRKYLMRLAGERLTGEPEDTFSNHHMERGKMMEHDAREHYAFVTDTEPRQVGFITNGPKGCSPDSLVGDDGLLEIKTALPSILLDKLMRDGFPPEHKAQCQGALWVAEREWIDLCVYWPGVPVFIKRATRDEAYIKTLAEAVDAFNEELDGIVEKLRARGSAPALEPTQNILAAG